MTWNTIWAAFAGLFFAGFLALETTSLTVPRETPGERNTFSSKIRRWLGVEPKKPRRLWIRVVFVGVISWFEIHILTPWL